MDWRRERRPSMARSEAVRVANRLRELGGKVVCGGCGMGREVEDDDVGGVFEQREMRCGECGEVRLRLEVEGKVMEIGRRKGEEGECLWIDRPTKG